MPLLRKMESERKADLAIGPSVDEQDMDAWVVRVIDGINDSLKSKNELHVVARHLPTNRRITFLIVKCQSPNERYIVRFENAWGMCDYGMSVSHLKTWLCEQVTSE